MPKYEIIIYWNVDDQAFIAEVPGLPGCSADGSTYQQALAHVEVVIQEWLETAKELDGLPPNPKADSFLRKPQGLAQVSNNFHK